MANNLYEPQSAGKRKLLRIKVNGVAVAKLSKQSNGNDYTFTFPKIVTGIHEVQSHFSLHTGRDKDRITFKIVSVKVAGEEKLPEMMKLMETSDDMRSWVRPQDIDVKGPRYITYPDYRLERLARFAMNLEGLRTPSLIVPSRSADCSFERVFNIDLTNAPKQAITIDWVVGKNIKEDPVPECEFDEIITLKDVNSVGDVYTHLFLFTYSFPDTSNSKDSNL